MTIRSCYTLNILTSPERMRIPMLKVSINMKRFISKLILHAVDYHNDTQTFYLKEYCIYCFNIF
eukprot:UN01735